MLCVLLGQITSCCANLFSGTPFSLASICILSFLKVKVASPKSDAILFAVNKRINRNSTEARWASQW